MSGGPKMQSNRPIPKSVNIPDLPMYSDRQA